MNGLRERQAPRRRAAAAESQSWRDSVDRRLATRLGASLLLIALGLLWWVPPATAQDQVMEVVERGEEGKATRLNLDFVNMEVQQLMRFLSKETNLTIIATEQDIQGKKLSLVNLRDVTVDEAIEKIKSGLMQFGLTMIRTDTTIIITTMQKAVKMKVPVTVGENPESIPDSDEVRTHVIPLKYLDAQQLGDQLRGMVTDQAVVIADQASNTIVITDVASNIRRIVTVIQSMDSQPEMALKVKVITLKNTQVRGVEQALRSLFREETRASSLMRRAGKRPDPDRLRKLAEYAKTTGIDLATGTIEISSNEDTNQLIVKASEENIAIIETLVTQLDIAPAIQTDFRVYRLKYASAKDVVDNLKEVLTGESGKRSSRDRWRPWWEQERGGKGKTIQGIIGDVRIAADDRLNGIIVGTDPRNYGIIDALIKEIDQEDRPQEEIEVFFLQNADAETVVQNINDLIQGQKQQQNQPWWWWDDWRRQNEQKKEGVFGLRGVVNLTADQRLNAIIAATSSANIQVLRDLIKRLDVSMPEQEWGTRIYALKYADAENIANILNSVYQGSSQSNQRRGFFFFLPSFMRQQRNQSRGSLAGNVVAEAYPTINAVIISTSTARNFDLVEEFLKQLDVPTPEEQREITRVFNLEYSNAEQLEQLLGDLWAGEQQGFNFGRLIARGFQPEQNDINSLSGKVRLLADPQTNSLVVTTRSRYMQDVEQIVRQLDIVRGQVRIDVTILEVTLDDSTKLGLEMQLVERRLFGADAFGKGRAPGKNPLTGTFESNLNLKTEATGFSFSLATKEYLTYLHTLMRRNQVRTLSRVPLFVRDNQTATFSSGRDIPYLQSARTSEFIQGQIFNFAFLEDVGINISITPHIARRSTGEEGKATIGLEIQQINASNFLEFTSFNAPLTETSTISTYIDAEDGQQIVIGGLKKQKNQQIVDKVPVLGDLPLIGRLFKRTETVGQDSEIVIIITPHIIDITQPADKERLQKLQEERFPGVKQYDQYQFDTGKRDNAGSGPGEKDPDSVTEE